MTLDNLWAGWRAAYVAGADQDDRVPLDAGSAQGAGEGCVFCALIAEGDVSPRTGIVWRGGLSVAMLNAFPYASGHLLVMPVRHVGALVDLRPEESADLWEATLKAARAIDAAYSPDGINLGANLGRAAGAGIPGHLHLHALPRWLGDTNFMTSIAGVRVMPEALPDSWEKLHRAWPG